MRFCASGTLTATRADLLHACARHVHWCSTARRVQPRRPPRHRAPATHPAADLGAALGAAEPEHEPRVMTDTHSLDRHRIGEHHSDSRDFDLVLIVSVS